jgi:hypothetical protein
MSLLSIDKPKSQRFIPNTDVFDMPSPDEIFANWHGIADNDLFATISKTFELPSDDCYIYRAESFAMTLAQIQEQVNSGKLKYKYQSHGQQIKVSSLGQGFQGAGMLIDSRSPLQISQLTPRSSLQPPIH